MNDTIKLTEKYLVDLLELDDIGRNKFLSKFVKIIANNGINHFFSLDSDWGSGKTVFVKKLELLINYYSLYENGEKIKETNFISENTELCEQSIQRLEKLSKGEDYQKIKSTIRDADINAVYFNAWEHDDESDPIISIIYEMVNKFDLLDSSKIIGTGKFSENLTSIVNLISLGKLNMGTLIKETDLCENVRRKDKIKESLQELFNNMINENCNKLVIFIDELDRCKPDYAISLLEKINHYITDERIIIVLSTNIKELIHTIGVKYGNEFSAEKYLDKFIDEHLCLPKVSLENYLRTFNNNISVGSSKWISIVMTHFMEDNDLQMREINRFMEIMNHFNKYLENKEYYGERHLQIIDYLFLPYMVGLYSTTPISYHQFINGYEFEKLKNFIMSNSQIIRLCKYSLYDTDKEISDDKLCQDVKNYYNLIFKQKEKSSKINIVTTIDSYSIDKSEFSKLYDNISLLGDISEFQNNNLIENKS